MMCFRKNKYYIILFIITLFFLLFFFITSDTVFRSLFNFHPSTSFPSQSEYIKSHFTFDLFMVEGFKPMQFIMPVLVASSSLTFLYEKDGFLFHYFMKNKDTHKKSLIKRLIIHCIKISICIFTAYVLFWLIGLLLFPKTNSLNDSSYYEIRETFSDIIGINFYLNYRYIFYLIEGILKCLPFSFIYGLFSMCIGLNTDKKYLSILIPVFFYFISIPLITSLPSFALKDYFYPNTIFVVGSMSQPNTFLLFLAFIPPIVIITVLLLKQILSKER